MAFFDILKKKKINNDNKEIKKIRLLFDYGTENIFFYNAEDFIISWDDSLIYPEWQKDEMFMSLNENLCKEYEELFINNSKELSYVGFKNQKHRTDFVKLVDEFVKYVKEKNNSKYEIINDYDIENL